MHIPEKLTSSQSWEKRVRIGRCRRRVDALDGALGEHLLRARFMARSIFIVWAAEKTQTLNDNHVTPRLQSDERHAGKLIQWRL